MYRSLFLSFILLTIFSGLCYAGPIMIMSHRYDLSPSDLPGLVLWLDGSDEDTITETSGSVSQWNDKSGNKHHAVQGTGSLQPAFTSGDNFVLFDGTDDYMSVPHSVSLDFATSDFTISFFIVGDTTAGTTPTILKKGAGQTTKAGFWIREDGNTSKIIFELSNGSGTYILAQTSNAVVLDNTLHHLLLSVTRAGNAVLYVDGVQDFSVDISSDSGTSLYRVDDLKIGSTNISRYWKGKILDVAMWKGTALTASQALSIFNAGPK